MTLEELTDNLSLNDSNYQCTLHNIPEEGRSHLHGGGNLKRRKREIISPLPEIKQRFLNKLHGYTVHQTIWKPFIYF